MAARQSALEKKLSDAVKLLEKNGYTVTPPAEPVKVDTTELNKRKLETRRNAFIEELRKYQGIYRKNSSDCESSERKDRQHPGF